jgi:type 1 glutamine amidotransferase
MRFSRLVPASAGLVLALASAALMVAAQTPAPQAPAPQAPAPAAAAPTVKAVPGQNIAPGAKRKIVFLAGPKDHGRINNGRHEYEKDLRALAAYLETSPNLKGMIETKVYVGKAPKDLSEVQDASAFVIESSSDRDAKEMHPLFPQEPATDRRTYDDETTAWLKEFDSIVKKGAGVAIFHYSTWVEHWVARRYYLQWIGALWVQGGSTNPVAEWAMGLKNESHPVLRGVKPWTYRDEVFCRYFLPNDARRTDLLIGTPSKAPNGPDVSSLGPQVAGWAYDRADGGRGFVMGGVDFHDNLSTVEDYRRFLLNGIVWSAGLDVPAGGVQSLAQPVAP